MIRPTLLLLWLAACDDGGATVVDAATTDAAPSDLGARDASGSRDAEASDLSLPDVAVDAAALADRPAPDGSPADAGGDAEWVDARATDAGPPPLFDLPAIRDPTTADCRFEGHRQVFRAGALLDVWDLSFSSWESREGVLESIRMRGFAARPAGAEGIPGVVGAHGLGGFSEEGHATGLAARVRTFVAVYTGPGGGTEPGNTSEGLPAGHDGGRRMFDVLPDPRGSWFWGHAVAAMRALTCVEHHPAVDPTRLGMTGFSAGGVATLMSAGVDDRIAAAVPLSATGRWDLAVRAPNAWQHGLLAEAGLDAESPEWLALVAALGPARLVAGTSAAVLMVNGTTDEFFPLTAHVATYDAIPTEKRTALVGNFDHGCYALSGVESADTIEARADLRAGGGQRMWFGHHFGTDPAFRELPAEPTLVVENVAAAAVATATIDRPGDVRRAHYWWSSDDAFLFGNVELERQGDVWAAIVPPVGANTVYYVDVEYRAGFALASRPHVPEALVPRIRAVNSCL